jgi:general stress protein 26
MRVLSYSEIEQEFIARVHTMVWCNMATMDTRDRVRSRIIHPVWEGGTGWATAFADSLKGKHIARNSYVSLAYISDVTQPVYVDCKAHWERDQSEKQRIWTLFSTFEPPLGFDPASIFQSVDDPRFGLLKFIPWRIELFDISNKANRKVWTTA